jgi:Rrf2 family protein
MRISKKAEYALRALALLATRPATRPVQIQELAEAGRIPPKFLEQILLSLRRAGILVSKRGLGGGYLLGRPASGISVLEIVELIDGPWRLADPAEPAPGTRGLEEILREADTLVREHLGKQTVASLILREDPSGYFDI